MEVCSLADDAFHEDRASVTLDDLMDNGQAESRSIAFRREQRFEDVIDHVARNPDSSIGEGNVDIALRVLDDTKGEMRITRFAPRDDDDLSPVRHRVTRIQGEVHQSLMKLIRITVNEEVVLDLDADLPRATDQSASFGHE